MSLFKPPDSDSRYERGAKAQQLARSQGFSINEGNFPKGASRAIPGICATCRNGFIIVTGFKDSQHDDVQVWCKGIDRRVPPNIKECSYYWRSGNMTLEDMGALALAVDGGRRLNPSPDPLLDVIHFT